MFAQTIVERLFGVADVKCNGPDPWDPQIHDGRFYLRILLSGSLGLGDSYMEGWWSCARLDEFIHRLLKSGITDLVPRFDDLWLKLMSACIDRQSVARGKRVAREHYDQDPDFFVGVLGETNSYTCGRWKNTDDLDVAQVQKMDLLCRKARFHEGQTVLDIGCGWGGFLAYAANKYGVRGIGLSISESQLRYAREHYGNLPIEFRREDYRDFRKKVDSAVSICMIEHVGPRHYSEYFSRIRDALPEDGLFALQCIIAKKPRSVSDRWVDKHIFPGGNLVTLERLHKATKGLFHILDAEYFVEDYVKTLRAWYQNLRARRAQVIANYGLSHYRKYEFYFLAFVGGFLSGRITVGQFVLRPSRTGDAYTPVRL